MTRPLPPAAVLGLCRELPATAGPPDWIELAPPGLIQGRDGRAFTNPDPTAVVAAFAAGQTDLPVDTEHSTHIRAPQGLDAPAAGWITEMQVRGGAIWGHVAWTDEGAAAIRSRAYRYYSPAYHLDPPTRAIVAIPSVGLTNKPNLALPALNQEGTGPDGPAPSVEIEIKVGASDPEPETPMAVPVQVLEALGLPPETTPEAAAAAITSIKSVRDTALNRAQTPDLNAFVPRADYETALNRATQAEQRLHDVAEAELNRQIEALLQDGLAAARITPATVEYHRAQARTEGGIERLKAYLNTAATVVDGSTRTGQPPAGTPELNQEAARIAAAFGNTPETLAQFGGAQ